MKERGVFNMTDESVEKKKKKGPNPDTLLVLAAFQAPSDDAAVFPVLEVIEDNEQDERKSGGDHERDQHPPGSS